MREKAIQFGTSCTLTGILSEPDREQKRDGAPGVLLLNSGILHRVGACRLHVQMARRLADDGFHALRFDFSGIGDSEARKDALSFEESAPLEVREAMDYLASTKGIEAFALVGLCSGADVAFFTARQDARVVALGQLDAWPYRTRRSYLQHYARRVGRPEAWTNFIRTRMERILGKDAACDVPGEDMELPTYVRECPPREEVAGSLGEMVGRGIHLLHVYTGGQEDYNYRRQFIDAFPEVDFGSRLTLEHMPEADHIFTGLDHQRQVVAMVSAWMDGVAGEESADAGKSGQDAADTGREGHGDPARSGRRDLAPVSGP
jgi:pimeloyl-ACP methyl ester carboxylesterase